MAPFERVTTFQRFFDLERWRKMAHPFRSSIWRPAPALLIRLLLAAICPIQGTAAAASSKPPQQPNLLRQDCVKTLRCPRYNFDLSRRSSDHHNNYNNNHKCSLNAPRKRFKVRTKRRLVQCPLRPLSRHQPRRRHRSTPTRVFSTSYSCSCKHSYPYLYFRDAFAFLIFVWLF